MCDHRSAYAGRVDVGVGVNQCSELLQCLIYETGGIEKSADMGVDVNKRWIIGVWRA